MPVRLLASLRDDLADLMGSDARLYAFARRAACLVVPLSLVFSVVLYGTGPEPRRNWYGDMLGNDFSNIWVAGRDALDGRPAEPYDLLAHLATLKAAFGPECRFTWHYPPLFLIPAAALAVLEPMPAFWLWSALSLGFFALAMTVASGGRRGTVLIALAHPLVATNVGYGQNGLFTAGLMTLGIVLVDGRPRVAGLCFGLLAYKPHFAALAPLVLLVTGRRECLAACVATVIALCLASLALFGTEPWLRFLATLSETNRLVLTDAAHGLDLNVSAFGAARLAGAPMAAAWALQGAVAAAALAMALRAWLGPASPYLRAAALLAAAPLLSPYVPVYDLAPLVPATLFLVMEARRTGGLRAHERALLAVSPLAGLARVAGLATGFSFGFALAFATWLCVLSRLAPFRAARRAAPAA